MLGSKLSYLWWFHVENFGDPALHDEEVGIVDIELDRTEQVFHCARIGIATIDQVLLLPTNNNLHTKIKVVCSLL